MSEPLLEVRQLVKRFGARTAVGGISLYVSGNLTKAAYWPASTLASDAVAIDLQAWQSKLGVVYNSQSTGNDINASGWIVGWSSSNAVPSRAVLKWAASAFSTAWIDLNDSHFVSGAPSWNLTEATAVNDSGCIVGKGTYNGSPRSFILIPRASGN